MAATDTQTLLSESECFNCFGELSIEQQLKLALLARILIGLVPDADTAPQALLDYAKCFNCFSISGVGDLMEMALLDQISQAV